MSVNDIYHKGTVLKSTARDVFVMVCDDGTLGESLDQTDTQFRAVILFDKSNMETPGSVRNNWNKGWWKASSFEEIFSTYYTPYKVKGNA